VWRSYENGKTREELVLDFSGGGSFAAADDCTRMTHATSGRRGRAGDKSGDRFLAVLLNPFGSLFFGVSSTDVATFAAASTLLLAVAAVAALLPGRHAARVDPVEALRGE